MSRTDWMSILPEPWTPAAATLQLEFRCYLMLSPRISWRFCEITIKIKSTNVRANRRSKTKTQQQRPNVGFMKVLGLALQLGSSCNNKNKYRISGTEHSVNAEACPMLYQTTNTAKVRPPPQIISPENGCRGYNRGRFNRPLSAKRHPRRIFLNSTRKIR